MRDSPIIRALATSFLAGESSVDEIYGRASHALGRRWPWLRSVAKRFVRFANGGTRLRHREVVRFLRQDSLVERALQRYRDEIFVKHWPIYASRMQPVEGGAHWPLPNIENEGALADWLDLESGELEWLADLNTFGSESGQEQLRNYHYRILAKQFGTIRLIEAPKKTLKNIQRKILTDILEKIPAHPAAHAFNKGRSIRTFVAPHVGRNVVLRLGLQDYFSSFGRARIQAMFRTVGYPERVADLLGGICTNSAPRSIGNPWYERFAHPSPGTQVSFMPSTISRRERQLRRHWRICAVTGSIVGWPDWQRLQVQLIRAKRMTWPFQATRALSERRNGFLFMSLPF